MLGYVCTNYNNSFFTGQAIRSLAPDASNIRVVVVDNASEPLERQKLREIVESHDFATAIFSNSNLGYFSGLNLGLEELRRAEPAINWMVVGNNDLEFPTTFYGRLLALKSTLESFSVIAPDVVTLDGEHQNPHVRNRVSNFREFLYDAYYSNYWLARLLALSAKATRRLSRRGDELSWQVSGPICQGHGSCYILSPRFFERFGRLSAPTFMMHEEYFLSQQLQKQGERVFYEPQLQVVHHYHAAMSKLPSKRRWEMARDAHQTYRRYRKGSRDDQE